MARRQVISTGKDVASAIIRGLNELGRRRDQVDVTVLQKPSKGFLGIGAKKARVQIVEKAWDSEHSTPMRTGIRKRSSMNRNQGNPKNNRRNRRPRHLVEKSVTLREPKANEAQKLPSPEIQSATIPDNLRQPMADARTALNGILNKMGIEVKNLNAWWDGKQERILLTFDCDSPALVIGKEAKTLQSIQYLITLMVSRSFATPISVVADTQNYWSRIEEKLNKDISYALMTIRRNKRPYRFRPMSAQLRRYIHHFLAAEQDIITVSEGEGKWRKVVLKIVKPEEKAAHIAAEQAAAEHKEHTIEAPECVTEETEHTDCVITTENTNCPAENNAAAETVANTTPQEPVQTQEAQPAPAEVKTETAEVKPQEAAPVQTVQPEVKPEENTQPTQETQPAQPVQITQPETPAEETK